MKRNTFSVLCYARKREQGKDKQYPIMVRITIDSEQVQFNSQLMVDKKMWKDGGVVGRSATAVYLRTNTFFICFSPKCILSLELRINLLCRLPFFLAFRFQVSYLLRKAFSVLTGNYRRFFNRSSHKSLYVVNYILFSIIEMKSCNFFPT